MKESTVIWAKFESKGYPHRTMISHGTAKEICLTWFKWIVSDGLYMGSRILVTMARTEDELDSQVGVGDDLAQELEALLINQGELPV